MAKSYYNPQKKREYYQTHKRKILSQRAEHYKNNKGDEHFVARRAAQAAKTRERDVARKRAKYAADKEGNLAKQRIYRENNKKKIAAIKRTYREANREYVAAKIKEWLVQNKDRVRVYRKNRRARKLGADGHYTPADISILWTSQNGKCAGIGCERSLELSCTVDHKIPLSRGGSNWPVNLQLLCKPCNSSKGTKTMEEWRRAP